MNGNHFDIHDLKREYEKGRKQGAVEELEILIALIENWTEDKGELKRILEKRLLELKGEKK